MRMYTEVYRTPLPAPNPIDSMTHVMIPSVVCAQSTTSYGSDLWQTNILLKALGRC